MEIDGCHFAHMEPWLDPTNLKHLWRYEGTPDEHGQLDRIFDAVPNRLIFMGHYHCWVLARPGGIVEWDARSSICLDDDRYFLVVGALCDSDYAIQRRRSSCRFTRTR